MTYGLEDPDAKRPERTCAGRRRTSGPSFGRPHSWDLVLRHRFSRCAFVLWPFNGSCAGQAVEAPHPVSTALALCLSSVTPLARVHCGCQNLIVTDFAPVTGDDSDFLWQMLYYASHSHHEPDTSMDDIQRNPDLTRHVVGWGERPGDIGLIARHDARPVGACWVRRLIGDEQRDVTFVDAETPELVIAVEPDIIGTGVGTLLLRNVLALADAAGVEQIVLTARETNPAVALYQRHDFVVAERIVNRVGTGSVKMVRVVA